MMHALSALRRLKNIIGASISIMVSATMASTAQAEGSRNLIESGLGYRSALIAKDHATELEPTPGMLAPTAHYVYAAAGERILLGASSQGIGEGGIFLVSPSGREQSCDPSLGRIENAAQESAGPRGASESIDAYIPCVIDVSAGETGLWQIEFRPSQIRYKAGDFQPTPSSEAWPAQKATDFFIYAWDATVLGQTASGFAEIPGRLFSPGLVAMVHFDSQLDAPWYANIFIKTAEGFDFRLETNGLDPMAYSFFSTRNPLILQRNATIDEQAEAQFISVSTREIPSKYKLRNPLDPINAQTTNRLYYNAPDPLLPSTTLWRGGESIWLNVRRPEIQAVSIEEIDLNEGTFTATITGDNAPNWLQLYADLDGDRRRDRDEPAFMMRDIEPGSFTYPADFLQEFIDGDKIWPEGAQVVAQFSADQGRMNFPLSDAEGHLNGFRLYRSWVNDEPAPLYWNPDDTFAGQLGAYVDDFDESGLPKITWRTDLGDERLINIWTEAGGGQSFTINVVPRDESDLELVATLLGFASPEAVTFEGELLVDLIVTLLNTGDQADEDVGLQLAAQLENQELARRLEEALAERPTMGIGLGERLSVVLRDIPSKAFEDQAIILEIGSQTERDIDSEPNNFSADRPREDDETSAELPSFEAVSTIASIARDEDSARVVIRVRMENTGPVALSDVTFVDSTGLSLGRNFIGVVEDPALTANATLANRAFETSFQDGEMSFAGIRLDAGEIAEFDYAFTYASNVENPDAVWERVGETSSALAPEVLGGSEEQQAIYSLRRANFAPETDPLPGLLSSITLDHRKPTEEDPSEEATFTLWYKNIGGVVLTDLTGTLSMDPSVRQRIGGFELVSTQGLQASIANNLAANPNSLFEQALTLRADDMQFEPQDEIIIVVRAEIAPIWPSDDNLGAYLEGVPPLAVTLDAQAKSGPNQTIGDVDETPSLELPEPALAVVAEPGRPNFDDPEMAANLSPTGKVVVLDFPLTISNPGPIDLHRALASVSFPSDQLPSILEAAVVCDPDTDLQPLDLEAAEDGAVFFSQPDFVLERGQALDCLLQVKAEPGTELEAITPTFEVEIEPRLADLSPGQPSELIDVPVLRGTATSTSPAPGIKTLASIIQTPATAEVPNGEVEIELVVQNISGAPLTDVLSVSKLDPSFLMRLQDLELLSIHGADAETVANLQADPMAAFAEGAPLGADDGSFDAADEIVLRFKASLLPIWPSENELPAYLASQAPVAVKTEASALGGPGFPVSDKAASGPLTISEPDIDLVAGLPTETVVVPEDIANFDGSSSLGFDFPLSIENTGAVLLHRTYVTVELPVEQAASVTAAAAVCEPGQELVAIDLKVLQVGMPTSLDFDLGTALELGGVTDCTLTLFADLNGQADQLDPTFVVLAEPLLAGQESGGTASIDIPMVTAQDTVSIEVPLTPPLLSMMAMSDKDNLCIGDVVLYTVTITNDQDRDAEELQLDLRFAEQVAPNSIKITTTNGVIRQGAPEGVNASIGPFTVPANSTATVEIPVMVTGTPPGNLLSYVAWLSSIPHQTQVAEPVLNADRFWRGHSEPTSEPRSTTPQVQPTYVTTYVEHAPAPVYIETVPATVYAQRTNAPIYVETVTAPTYVETAPAPSYAGQDLAPVSADAYAPVYAPTLDTSQGHSPVVIMTYAD